MSYKEWIDESDYLIKEWRNDAGKIHNDDGPARIEYHSSGFLLLEKFYKNGKLHREDGPASIWYKKNGVIDFYSFWFNGAHIGLLDDGFWALWDRLNDEQRKNPNILKFLLKYSDN